MSLSKPQRLCGSTSAATEGIPCKNKRVFWLEAAEGWQLGNGTKRHLSVIFGESFYQLNLHSPFPPQTREHAAEERRTFELTVPSLHQQHSLRPEGDEGRSLEGVGGTARPCLRWRASATEVRLRLQGQQKPRAVFLPASPDQTGPYVRGCSRRNTGT